MKFTNLDTAIMDARYKINLTSQGRYGKIWSQTHQLFCQKLFILMLLLQIEKYLLYE